MQPFWKKFLRHAIIVGVCLAAVGYLLGKGFLLSQRIYGGGGVQIEDNDRVLWQTPLVMASLGIAMTGAIDLLSAFIRRSVTLPAPSTSAAETGI